MSEAAFCETHPNRYLKDGRCDLCDLAWRETEHDQDDAALAAVPNASAGKDGGA